MKNTKQASKKTERQLAEKIVGVVNKTTNDYDAADLVEKELWDHYSGLPNPNWYAQNIEQDKQK